MLFAELIIELSLRVHVLMSFAFSLFFLGFLLHKHHCSTVSRKCALCATITKKATLQGGLAVRYRPTAT
jgi:hypothetical protein